MAQIYQFPRVRRMTLEEARRFLGHNFFKKALLYTSLERLDGYCNAGEAILTGASEAYEAILEFRRSREVPTEHVAPVVPLKRAA